MEFLTEIQKARVEFYKSHPEGIIRTLPIRSVAICHRCRGEMSLKENCLFQWKQSLGYKGDKHECPHCGNIGKVEIYDNHRIVKPIEHTVVTVVEHIISEKTVKDGWFGTKIVVESIKEYL